MSALTAEDVRREQLAALGRQPFTDQIADWLTRWNSALSRPEALAELERWMLRHPDRAAQAQAIFARLAGYSDRLEVKTDRYASLDTLSDAELEAEVSRRLGLTPDALRAMAAKPVQRLDAQTAERSETLRSLAPGADPPRNQGAEGSEPTPIPATPPVLSCSDVDGDGG